MKIHMTGEWFHTLTDGRTSVRYRPGVTYNVDKNVGEMAIAAGRAVLSAPDPAHDLPKGITTFLGTGWGPSGDEPEIETAL